MGRGFGRGAKSVGIVTHAQVKGAKKMPKGLRGSRKSRRRQFKGEHDDQTQLEQSMGVSTPPPSSSQKKKASGKSSEEGGTKPARTLAQEIAGIQFQQVIHGKRQKGFKSLRKQLLASVKDVRRRYTEKQRLKNKKEEALMAARHEAMAEKHVASMRSGNVRRSQQEEAAAAAAASKEDDKAAQQQRQHARKNKKSRKE